MLKFQLRLHNGAHWAVPACTTGDVYDDEAAEPEAQIATTPTLRAVHNGAYYFSMLVQVAGLVTSVVALTSDEAPDALVYLVALDLAVQVIEFAWYAGVWALLGSVDKVPTRFGYRYIDWVLSTPVMLVSLLQFARFRKHPCTTTIEDLYTADMVLALVVTVVADLLMLAVGISYELPNSETAKGWARWLDSVVGGAPRAGLLLGFGFFAAAFAAPAWVTVDAEDAEAGALLVLTLFFWLFYGVAAVVFPGVKNGMARSTIYSILDAFAKNAVGILLAALVLAWETDACA